jgi:hypothetical protein
VVRRVDRDDAVAVGVVRVTPVTFGIATEPSLFQEPPVRQNFSMLALRFVIYAAKVNQEKRAYVRDIKNS